MRRLFRQFSFPGGIPSHVAPETPGSIHEGGELGYALAHAYGAAFDNPDLVVCARRRRRRGRDRARWPRAGTRTSSSTRAATARCCRSCTSTATRSPTRRARPHPATTSCARCCDGYGHEPYFVEGDDPAAMHQPMAATLDAALDEIRAIQRAAREDGATGPAALADDRAAHAEGLDRPEGGRRPAGRGHLPLAPGAARRRSRATRTTCAQLEEWLRSYRPEELFDDDGAPVPELARARARAASGAWAPTRTPTAACCCATSSCRTSATTPSTCRAPGARDRARRPRVLGRVPARRRCAATPDRFRLFGPDETASNRLRRRLRGDRPAPGTPRSCPTRRPPRARTAG